MLEQVRRHCKEALDAKRLDLVYGVGNRKAGPAPRFFSTAEELDELVLAGKEPLVFTCRPSDRNVVDLVRERSPTAKLGIVARGCDERALFELAKRFQLSLDGIEIIGVACDQAQAEECRCPRPYPKNLAFGTPLDKPVDDPVLEKLQRLPLEERLAFWRYQLSKCVKCYGCRNACPMCFCKECQMEGELFVPRGAQPPEFPTFHFVQLIHLADRCIDCGECERACPMDIPLRLLKKSLRSEVRERFGYEAGVDPTTASPLGSIERGEPSHAE
ncbi:MAG: 4Fe-4S binding protein [Deltaproteobacteria bacterium]|nr:4Fe-4S binding protein [Deltaproteobacteria bacterium]